MTWTRQVLRMSAVHSCIKSGLVFISAQASYLTSRLYLREYKTLPFKHLFLVSFRILLRKPSRINRPVFCIMLSASFHISDSVLLFICCSAIVPQNHWSLTTLTSSMKT